MTALEVDVILTDEHHAQWTAGNRENRSRFRRAMKGYARNTARQFYADAAIIKAPDGTVLERVKV